MLRKMVTLVGSAMGTMAVIAALVLFPAPALADAGPPLPWRQPLPLQLSVIGLLFVFSAGVSLSGWWLLRRVERAVRRQREEGV
jgi:hypothetical protein